MGSNNNLSSSSDKHVPTEDTLPIQAVVYLPSYYEIFLSCQTLPTGVSLLVANLALFQKASIQQTNILAHHDFIDFIKLHLSKSQKHLRGLKVDVIEIPNDGTHGDVVEVLRNLESRGQLQLLHQDFLLIHGNTIISQLDLNLLLETHRSIKKDAKKTRLYTRLVTPQAMVPKKLKHTNSANKEVIIWDGSNGNIINFEKCSYDCSSIEINETHLRETSDIRILTNFLDNKIGICSSSFMSYLFEEFDCRTLYPDMIERVLGDALKINSIGVVVFDGNNNFSQHITSHYLLYNLIYYLFSNPSLPSWFNHLFSNDVLQQLQNRTTLQVITPDGVQSICSGVVSIGKRSQCSKTNTFVDTFVGKNCTFGSNTNLVNCIICDNTKIGNNVSCTRCFIGSSKNINDNDILENEIIIEETFPVLKQQIDVSMFTMLENNDTASYDLDMKNKQKDAPLMTIKEFLREDKKLSVDVEQVSEDLESSGTSEDTDKIEINHAEELDLFHQEIFILAYEGFMTPEIAHHKLLEIQSFRLSCNQSLMNCIRPSVHAMYRAGGHHYGKSVKEIIAIIKPKTIFETIAPQYKTIDQLMLLNSMFFFSNLTTILDEDENKELPNPFFTPMSFCIALKEFASLDIFDDSLLPEWKNSMLEKKDQLSSIELEKLYSNPMKQYIDWLDASSSSEDDDI